MTQSGRRNPKPETRNYSVLKLFTGLATAALIAWKLTVSTAMQRAIAAVIRNTSQPIFVRYAKSRSHLLITHQATGDAITIDIATSFKKSFDKSVTIPATLAPKTLRTPISFVRCSALNVANPNNPRQQMRMAMMVKYPTIEP